MFNTKIENEEINVKVLVSKFAPELAPHDVRRPTDAQFAA